MVPTRRRTCFSSFLESAYRSRSPRVTLPLIRATVRVRALKSVDLPAPEAPMTATLSSGSTSRFRLSSASVSPKQTVTPARESREGDSSLLLCGEEVKLGRLFFDVVVIFGLDPLVTVGAQEVQKRRVVYVEEGLRDLLFELVRKRVAHHPRVALDGLGLLYNAHGVRFDGAL